MQLLTEMITYIMMGVLVAHWGTIISQNFHPIIGLVFFVLAGSLLYWTIKQIIKALSK